MESPVWTPMGSMFSMEQMMTTLSARSRMTSSSYSFQPSRDISMSTCTKEKLSQYSWIFDVSMHLHMNEAQSYMQVCCSPLALHNNI